MDFLQLYYILVVVVMKGSVCNVYGPHSKTHHKNDIKVISKPTQKLIANNCMQTNQLMEENML